MNWKTTATAIVVAAAAMQATIQAGAKIEDWRTWILPVVIALFGYFTKDATPNQ